MLKRGVINMFDQIKLKPRGAWMSKATFSSQLWIDSPGNDNIWGVSPPLSLTFHPLDTCTRYPVQALVKKPKESLTGASGTTVLRYKGYKVWYRERTATSGPRRNLMLSTHESFIYFGQGQISSACSTQTIYEEQCSWLKDRWLGTN